MRKQRGHLSCILRSTVGDIEVMKTVGCTETWNRKPSRSVWGSFSTHWGIKQWYNRAQPLTEKRNNILEAKSSSIYRGDKAQGRSTARNRTYSRPVWGHCSTEGTEGQSYIGSQTPCCVQDLEEYSCDVTLLLSHVTRIQILNKSFHSRSFSAPTLTRM
jgi:hypothetical protein